jgi:hypothetical protein
MRLSCLALEEVAAPRKQIISLRSFGQLVHTLHELSESVASSSAVEKLRREKEAAAFPVHLHSILGEFYLAVFASV